MAIAPIVRQSLPLSTSMNVCKGIQLVLDITTTRPKLNPEIVEKGYRK